MNKRESLFSKFPKSMTEILKKFARANFSGKVAKSGWHRIPAVSGFKVWSGEWNPLLKAIGINKKLPKSVLIDIRYSNNLNKYMAFQIRRLRKLRDEGRTGMFWTVAYALLKRSVAFRVSALNHVLEGWYWNRSYGSVLGINRQVSKLLLTKSFDFKVERVYIPKGLSDEELKWVRETYGEDIPVTAVDSKGKALKWRPLGVPSPAWRVLLHMWNNMLLIFFENHFLPSQHGFIPGRGTLTAWREVLSKVIKAEYIWETDLRGFFPNVKSTRITEVLLEAGIPKKIAYWLENINRKAPHLPDKLYLDESDATAKAKGILEDGDFTSPFHDFIRVQLRQAIFDISGYIKMYKEEYPDNLVTDPGMDEWMELLEPSLKQLPEYRGWLTEASQRVNDLVLALFGEAEVESLEEYIQVQWALLDEYKPTWVGKQFNGVAQGAPTSPLLAILTLKDFLSQVPSVSYADDPIFYSDKPISIKDEPNNGIYISWEKSHLIKEKGVWLKPLKYLGLVYDPWNQTLSSDTRKGTKEEMNQALINLWEDMKYNSEDTVVEDMAKTNFFGFITACLYKGSWNDVIENIGPAWFREMCAKAHKKSLAKTYPKNRNTYSSVAVLNLCRDIRRELLKVKYLQEGVSYESFVESFSESKRRELSMFVDDKEEVHFVSDTTRKRLLKYGPKSL